MVVLWVLWLCVLQVLGFFCVGPSMSVGLGVPCVVCRFDIEWGVQLVVFCASGCVGVARVKGGVASGL